MKQICQPIIFTVMSIFGMLVVSSPVLGIPKLSQSLIAQSDKIECAKNARSQGFTPQQAVKLCRRATQDTIECAKNARSEGFTLEQAVKLCRRATQDTIECAKNARSEGFTLEQAADLCKNRQFEDCLEK
jgi:hypothetical protein